MLTAEDSAALTMDDAPSDPRFRRSAPIASRAVPTLRRVVPGRLDPLRMRMRRMRPCSLGPCVCGPAPVPVARNPYVVGAGRRDHDLALKRRRSCRRIDDAAGRRWRTRRERRQSRRQPDYSQSPLSRSHTSSSQTMGSNFRAGAASARFTAVCSLRERNRNLHGDPILPISFELDRERRRMRTTTEGSVTVADARISRTSSSRESMGSRSSRSFAPSLRRATARRTRRNDPFPTA